MLRSAVFHPEALRTIRTFPEDVRRELGKAIFDLQQGETLKMPLSRPMVTVGSGVEEIRIRDRSGNYRAFYLARSEKRVLVFHAFMKKHRKTPHSQIDLGKRRLREMLNG